MVSVLAAGLVAVGVAGVWLLVVGLRGRRIDDHPVCRACRFDLVGVYPGVGVCPECGAKTDGERAVRIGRRWKRRWAIACGAVVLLGAAGGGGAVGWASARNYDWNRSKPLWWLMRDTGSADRAIAGPAVREVTRRISGGRLGRSAAAPFIAAALDNHLTPFNQWSSDWSTLFNAARARGLASPEEYQRYLKQGVRFATVRHASRVRERRPLHVTASMEWGPFGMNAPDLRLVLRTFVKIGDHEVEAHMDGDREFVVEEQTQGSSSGAQGPGGWPFHAPIDTAPGRYDVAVRATIDVFDAASPSDAPILTLSQTLTGGITVVKRGEPVVELVVDDQHRAEVRASVRPLTSFRAGVLRGRTQGRVSLHGDDRRTPVQVVARQLVRIDGHEYWLGDTRVWGPGGSSGAGSTTSYDRLPGSLPATVDIILRPDAQKAEELGHDAIWGEDIVIAGVEVEWLGEISDPRVWMARPPGPVGR